MGWLDPLIKRAVTEVVEKSIPQHIDAAIDRALADNPRIQFIKTMQMQMLACDPDMDKREAWNVAVNTLRAFLEEEETKFGDPAFDWTRSGAVEMIHEYEIHHWEPRP